MTIRLNTHRDDTLAFFENAATVDILSIPRGVPLNVIDKDGQFPLTLEEVAE